MTVLTREAFLAGRPALKRERVAVPELGEGAEVIVQEMTAAARERYAASVYEVGQDVAGTDGPPQLKNRAGEMYALMLVFSVVNEAGELLFTEVDVTELASWPSALMERLVKAAYRLNGMDQASAEAARKN